MLGNQWKLWKSNFNFAVGKRQQTVTALQTYVYQECLWRCVYKMLTDISCIYFPPDSCANLTSFTSHNVGFN